MTPDAYRAALETLGLSQLAAGRWLGVSPKTAQRYAVDGPSGPAARAVGTAVAVLGLEQYNMRLATNLGSVDAHPDRSGRWVRHSDLTAAVGLKE